jgi:hypothetical protein
MLGERMKWNIMVDGNDKIDLKNKLNVDEYKILECRKFKSLIFHDIFTREKHT